MLCSKCKEHCEPIVDYQDETVLSNCCDCSVILANDFPYDFCEALADLKIDTSNSGETIL